MADTHNTPTLEEINQAMESVSHHAAASAAAAPTAAAAPSQICAIWPAVKKVLQLIVALPFVPESWKKVIRQFIAVVDALCGGTK